MSINLSQIEAFCAVVSAGSVSEAARVLDCNRTKLSMAIKALEKDLDTDLFVRTGNNVTLSETGKAIYKDCENLLITSARIRQTCAQVSGDFATELRIAHDDSLPDQVWQDLTLELNQRYPALSLNIVLASSGDLSDIVEKKQVDFAFGVDFEREDDPRLTYQPLGKIRMMSVCRADHKLSRLPRVSDEVLRDEMQVSLAYLNLRDNPELLPFSLKYIGFSSFEFMLKTILSEGAWGVLPEPLIRQLLREQTLSVIKHTYGLTQEDFCMLTSSGMSEHPAMTWLADQVSDYLFTF